MRVLREEGGRNGNDRESGAEPEPYGDTFFPAHSEEFTCEECEGNVDEIGEAKSPRDELAAGSIEGVANQFVLYEQAGAVEQ